MIFLHVGRRLVHKNHDVCNSRSIRLVGHGHVRAAGVVEGAVARSKRQRYALLILQVRTLSEQVAPVK